MEEEDGAEKKTLPEIQLNENLPSQHKAEIERIGSKHFMSAFGKDKITKPNLRLQRVTAQLLTELQASLNEVKDFLKACV
ncbi:hypothetical protein [Dyadobacter chenhuakuii]|uniref:Uncharacterized protein n=1 Tax=Dyadobacter chenhuakuii TaxID=2909339 RepID=A0ABY5E8G2_9BACT|nr:hypothetical protein [Dyadobacter chenhuakuii]UTM21749.1 hypothetical protein NFI80_25495 [Dyadobacter chenhuakuii]